MRHIIAGAQILIDSHWVKDQAIVIEDQTIKAIIPAHMTEYHLPAEQINFPEDFYMVPGFIDLHIHGTHGNDVMDGTAEALNQIAHHLAQEGVTGFLATTMTAPVAALEKTLANIAAYQPHAVGAALLGIHLEGPFIAESKLGAQSRHALKPDLALFNRWQQLAQHKIKLVTLAPELPNAMAFISALRASGVIVSAGHTNADFEAMEAAITAGCSQATHLFNAMRGLHHRDPGLLGALLRSDLITAEIIVDGLHLHPAIVDIIWQLKGNDKLLLVTDAMRAKCMPAGEYDLGGQVVNMTEGKATLADGTLAGSTLSMPQAIKNMAAFTPCSLADAVRMASLIPARVLGIEKAKGSIAVGKDADIVVLNKAFDPVLTICQGMIVSPANAKFPDEVCAAIHE